MHFNLSVAMIRILLFFLVYFSLESILVAGIDVSVIQKSLGRQPETASLYTESVVFSPDMQYIAFVAASDGGMQVFKNAKAEKKYDHIAKGYPVFSPVQSQLGYIADKNGRYYVIIAGKESPEYDGACCLKFSPNGKYNAFIAQDKEKQFVVLNGHRMKSFDMIDRAFGVLFSPDSTKVAYVAKNISENKVRLILNGDETPPRDTISEVVFRPDSGELAYIATIDREYFVFRGDTKEGPYDKAEGLIWAPGSKQLAYIVIKGGKFLIVNNGVTEFAGDFSPQTIFYESGGYASRVQQITPPVFSPDGSLMAFTRVEKGKFRFVIGGRTGPFFDSLSAIVFSPDSKHFAYIGVNRTSEGVRMQVIHDQTRSPFYEEIDKPVFSPDSRHLAYRVGNDGKSFMVFDGEAQNPYDTLGLPYFSPDSSKMAYRAKKAKHVIMVVNGEESSFLSENRWTPIDNITPPCFSPSGRYLAYLVHEKTLQCKLVINGDAVRTFNGVSPPPKQIENKPLVFDSDDRARFLLAFLEERHFEAFRIDLIINERNLP